MASFPNSVFAPPTRTAGQQVGSAHMNAVQDEIVAIEDGYRNGTAPLNSSGSTLANLRVTVSPPHARVYSTVLAQVAHNSQTLLSYDTQRVISSTSMHSTTTNPSRLTVPTTGVYAVYAHVTWAAFSTGGLREVLIRLNGETYVAGQRTQPASSGAAAVYQSVGTVWRAETAGDYFQVFVYQDSGSTGSLVAGNSTNAISNDFTLMQLR